MYPEGHMGAALLAYAPVGVTTALPVTTVTTPSPCPGDRPVTLALRQVHMSDEQDENPPVRIPESEDDAEELALEGDEEEPRVSEQQRRNLAEVHARLIGDL